MCICTHCMYVCKCEIMYSHVQVHKHEKNEHGRGQRSGYGHGLGHRHGHGCARGHRHQHVSWAWTPGVDVDMDNKYSSFFIFGSKLLYFAINDICSCIADRNWLYIISILYISFQTFHVSFSDYLNITVLEIEIHKHYYLKKHTDAEGNNQIIKYHSEILK